VILQPFDQKFTDLCSAGWRRRVAVAVTCKPNAGGAKKRRLDVSMTV